MEPEVVASYDEQIAADREHLAGFAGTAECGHDDCTTANNEVFAESLQFAGIIMDSIEALGADAESVAKGYAVIRALLIQQAAVMGATLRADHLDVIISTAMVACHDAGKLAVSE